jgi:hypothetical protein
MRSYSYGWYWVFIISYVGEEVFLDVDIAAVRLNWKK